MLETQSGENAQSDFHGIVGGYIPERADWTIDQNWAAYTPEEHATWKTLYERQMTLIPGRASQAYLDGLAELPITADRIPDFEALSDALEKRTGWRVVAVPGMVPNDVFFNHMANRRFPAGQFIRKARQLDYLQEPDVFHDIFGHVPMMVNPVMADFMQAYGEGGLRAERLGVLDYLARLYWYTVEFGLIEEAGGMRIFGGGILSSFTETRFALESASPNRIGFDLERVMRTAYRIDEFQETYFVMPSLDTLFDMANTDFAPIYEKLKALPDFGLATVTPDDHVFTRGTGDYHRALLTGA
ncbi:phenylalanine 4-monooxygenase [Asticcacaulis sp. 201]|uniref:phenylalanine 4-monooxygenase n=1 Tax=Asticcacaulis sp. 201 TaxID=3028787 RepID=UPI0029162E2D|nr:phenylalanine 4-monooxygenase [Asticcacaulis sp. 201]MDV6332235.1 phenylalanine 4-monooxygenase [Asticcacaulis sp. 201]